MLILLRGNSGSGKSTTAKLLREKLLAQNSHQKIAVIEQDYLRRTILKEKEVDNGDNIELIFQTAKFAFNRQYDVILEGILYSKRYSDMLRRLISLNDESCAYYFDISLEETIKRHQNKPNADEFGEKELRQWYHPHDMLGFGKEKELGEHLSQAEVIELIMFDIVYATD